MQKAVCKWLSDDVCVNDESDYCGDFPSDIDCEHCKEYEKAEKKDGKCGTNQTRQ